MISKSTTFISNKVFIISINPDDLADDYFGIFILKQTQNSKLYKVVLDLNLFETISSNDISRVERLIKILKLNNIATIVCGINPYSASILLHFINEVKFKTSLNIQSAINAF